MSKKFLLSLSYLSLCKFFWTRTENRVIENRVMENRVKRGITVHKLIFRTGWGLKPTSFTSLILILDSFLRITDISIIFLLQMWQQRIGDLDIGFLNVILKEHANIYLENVVVLKKDNINANRRKVNRKVFYSTNFYFPSQACGGKLEMLFEVRQWNKNLSTIT